MHIKNLSIQFKYYKKMKMIQGKAKYLLIKAYWKNVLNSKRLSLIPWMIFDNPRSKSY